MRRKRLNLLIYLSALSAVALYVVQGALATGADVQAFPAWFWTLDLTLWGARALIEAAVIVYLFTTTPTTPGQRVTLALLEIALVSLITFTVGPALRAVGLGQAMVESVTPAAFTAWSFGIAAYTSLMVGAAGYAFRVEGDARETIDVDGLRSRILQLEREIAQHAHAVEAWGLLNKTQRARLIKACTNGDRPSAVAFARATGQSPANVRRAWAEGETT